MKLLISNIAIMLLSYLSVKSQIIYTDVDPDTTISVSLYNNDTTKYFYLDINNDSLDDFKFTLDCWYSFASPSSNTGAVVYITSVNSNNMIACETIQDGPSDALALDSDDTINYSLNWKNSSTILFGEPQNIVDNNFNFTKYLPYKIYTNGAFYFGWIKISADYDPSPYVSNASLTIYDYAYNSTPNQFILAGQIITGNNYRIANDSSDIIFSNNLLSIKSNENINNLVIINSSGKVIAEKNFSANELNIDLSNYNKGIYFVKLTSVNKTITKTIFVI